MPARPAILAVLTLASFLSTPALCAEPAPTRPEPADLMKRGLYHDAVRVLQEEVKGQPEEQCGEKFLMLGESHYMLKMYNEARPYFVKAKRLVADDASKVVADYRLACVAYRMGDAASAQEKITDFVAKHPKDRRSGILLLFKMKLVAAKGKGAMAEVEAIHRQIRANESVYSDAAAVAADKALTDFYVEHGEEEKARQRYTSTVHNFRNVIAEYEKDKRPVPQGLEQAHDHAAMQLGIISLKANKLDEAARWLENVKYSPDLKREARLLLAQTAYQKRDFDKAMWFLLRDGFIETVPPGTLRSDMYLLLGLAEKSKPNANLNKVVEWLTRVERVSAGFPQAQLALGELFRDRGLADRAVQAFENALAAPRYEAQCLLALGELYVEQANASQDKAKQDALCRKAAEALSQLTTKYPTSQFAKDARKTVDALLAKGLTVSVALSDEEMVRRWDQTAREKPGSAEAARSLLNIIRLHHKTVMDAKGQRMVKAPNYAACAGACERLLDGKVYTGQDLTPEQWKDLRVEALYYRGLCHLASATATGKEAAGPITPTFVKPASLDTALADFAQAKQLVNPKHLDLVKGIELGLLEAQFKSGKADLRKQAEARFAELVNEYGTDLRFQKLAMDLAEWYRDQGQFALAAREYRGIADRGANLTQEDRLKATFEAGRLYSKAAFDIKSKPGEMRYGIYIYPKEVLKLPELLKTHKPFLKPVRLKWPERAKDLSGEDALLMVSKAADIPFVWSPEGGRDSVSDYLRRKRVKFESLQGTVEEFLRQVLDMQNHRLELDIGLTGGKPTIEPKPRSADDPDAEPMQVIEIYDTRLWTRRFRPLARDYGNWRQVHTKSAMLFHVVQRIEELSDTKVLYAEGMEKEHALGAEFAERDGKLYAVSTAGGRGGESRLVGGYDPRRNAPCAEVLAAVLEPLDLRFRIVPRDRSAELYEDARACFNQIRQVDPKSRYGERALFQAAINYYHQEDFERMKLVLTDYLRLFDTAAHDHYHEACFWVGWVLEREKRYRDATRYYNRAAEECLVLFRPTPPPKPEEPPKDKAKAPDAKAEAPKPPEPFRNPRDELKAQLSYDTRFALEEAVNGAFRNYTLEKEFVEFLRMSANVTVRLDASALGIQTPINREPFKQVPVFTLLCDTLDALGLSFRVENTNKEQAERAYHRMAAAYKKDGLMDQALASCNVLLARFPNTSRKRDALKLKLDIYKGLKDYRNVLATLEVFKKELGDEIEAYKIDFEMACIYGDLCRYAEAAEGFKKALAAAKEPGERVNIREGYARALFRKGDRAEALSQFRTLAQEEQEPLRAFVHRMMAWYLDASVQKAQDPPLPAEAAPLIRQYEAIPEDRRGQVPNATLAKITWVYYVTALLDLEQGQTQRALKKFEAAGNSPDDWLAADAIYRAGELHMQAKDFAKARETLEYLLFSTKSAEAEVKATYALGLCHQELGEADRAKERFGQVLARFPDSAYAEKVRAASRVPRAEEKAGK
ncbi:MAG: tetratricopeptide repeat protein [Planctomycetes bacterium]|nr:tetratricopeptide repeat protein [Planctomycetota bacterium]